MGGDIYTRTTVHFYREVHEEFVREVGSQNVSEFLRLVEEDLLFQPDEDKLLSLRMRARKATECAKHRFFQQRKLIQEEEDLKARMAAEQLERKNLIEQEVRAAVRKIGFRREWLRDPPGMNFSHHRRELEDEVSIACRLDLQFKDLLPIVAKEVLGGDS